MTTAEIEKRVIEIVADALDKEPAKVSRDSSLIDDLGAESIDFLDIVFRLETAYDIQIPESEIWKGSFDFGDGDEEAVRQGLLKLKERLPDFRWDRLPARMTKQDLARLITVQTIVDYLVKVLNPAQPEA